MENVSQNSGNKPICRAFLIIASTMLFLMSIALPAAERTVTSPSRHTQGESASAEEISGAGVADNTLAHLAGSLMVEKLFGVGGLKNFSGHAGGCNGQVNAIVAKDTLLYMGGSFTSCEDAVVANVVIYNPRTRRYSAIPGLPNGDVRSMTLFQGEVIAAGSFRTVSGAPADYIARWDGVRWNPFGTSTNGPINALLVYQNALHIGGEFTTAGGVSANHVARWDGSAWRALNSGVGGSLPKVNALGVWNNALIVGGQFQNAGGQPATNVARWDGTRFTAIGSEPDVGVRGEVNVLASLDGTLHAGGNMLSATLARFDGTRWEYSGPVGRIRAIQTHRGRVYVGGFFETQGVTPLFHVAELVGGVLGPMVAERGVGVGNEVFALASYEQDLYVGGFFRTAGGFPAIGVAYWTGSTWSALGDSLVGTVRALALSGNELIVGGDFLQAGGQTVNGLARWNGSTWSSFAGGVRGIVNTILVSGSNVYVGGSFSSAGARSLSNVARWDGANWSGLGSGSTAGTNGTVTSLVELNNSIYVAGEFTEANRLTVNNIARWDGSAFSSLGVGTNGRVEAMTTLNGGLFAGGSFTLAGGQLVNRIARWDGQRWQPVTAGGSNEVGFNATVSALTVSAGIVYAGGAFGRINGRPASFAARWNGAEWSALGSGPANAVTAIVIDGSFVYAGGQTGVSRFDGNAWSALGTLRSAVLALTADGVALYAGGNGLTQTPLPELLSRSTAGVTAAGASRTVATTRSGAKVAFSSDAGNLIAGDTNGRNDVFVRDLLTGTLTRASAAAEAINGGTAEAFSSPAISADGARVAFAGSSGQIYANFGGQGRVISRSAAGALGNGPSGAVQLPGTGTRAVFESQATNLLATSDANGSLSDIYMTDLSTGAVALVSRAPDGGPANGASSGAWSSDDGQTIAFSSLATNLATGAAPAKNGTIRQAQLRVGNPFGQSVSYLYLSRNLATNELGNGDSINLRLTPDGRVGVFESLATNLVPGDTNGVADIFRFELNATKTAVVRLDRVSTSRYNFEGNGASRNPSVCDDGQFVAFATDASNLIELDRNNRRDVLIKWMVTGEAVRLSRTADGNPPNGDSSAPYISGDCSSVYFESLANNLSANDNNNAPDIYGVGLRERTPEVAASPTTQDEPALSRFPLPTPNPANASCPSGFFSAVVDDGPGSGLTAGAFGMEVLLDEPGTRVLAGGLNFGGLIDTGQVGFAGFTIANPANEGQRLNLRLTGSPASSSTASLPVRVRIARRTATTSETVFEATPTISLAAPYLTSIDLPPAFYEATVAPVSGSAGGSPEGQFFFSLTTSFINRPGGGFQGGAVVGGYHATHPFGGVSGFAAFCLATPHSTSIRVLSQPSYGPTGAKDLRLRVQDAQQRDVVVVPGG